jgi:hypothetical protein
MIDMMSEGFRSGNDRAFNLPFGRQFRMLPSGRGYRPNEALLVQDLHVTVVNAATGEVLRDLIIDPRRDDQPAGRPKT